jgi:nucleoside transporter
MAVSTPSAAPPLALPLRLQLSVLMFLQFAIWGSWFTLFTSYLEKVLQLSGTQAGVLFGNMALGAILSNLAAGYIADRYVSSEKLLGVLHLLGAAALYWMASVPAGDGAFNQMFAASLAYALLYNPTLALANSVTFRHVPDGGRDFPGVRVVGTVGWIAAGFATTLFAGTAADGTALPAFLSSGPLLMAAGLSAVLGVYSFVLPHTPPTSKPGDAVPFVKALGLFKDYSFAVFFGVSLVITVVLAFYYGFTGPFLADRAKVEDVGGTMAYGQIAELVLLPFLPIFLYRLGMKWVLALGMLCWGLRYFLFSLGGPEGLAYSYVLIGILLHGICFDFFFAAGFIHVDDTAPADIRASGQALFSFLTYGVGMWLGNLLSGVLKDQYTDPATKATDWTSFWQVPSAGVAACLVVFVLFFRSRPERPPETPTDPGAKWEG